jgi:hypothetical protein
MQIYLHWFRDKITPDAGCVTRSFGGVCPPDVAAVEA